MIKSIKDKKANKTHTCVFCQDKIEIGKIHKQVVTLDTKTNHHSSLKYHLDCYEKHEKAEDDFIRREMRQDNMNALRDTWDRAYQ